MREGGKEGRDASIVAIRGSISNNSCEHWDTARFAQVQASPFDRHSSSSSLLAFPLSSSSSSSPSSSASLPSLSFSLLRYLPLLFPPPPPPLLPPLFPSSLHPFRGLTGNATILTSASCLCESTRSRRDGRMERKRRRRMKQRCDNTIN